MVLTKKVTQTGLSAVTWNRNLSLNKKLAFLKSYFGEPLDKVSFWKLYKTVKKFNS